MINFLQQPRETKYTETKKYAFLFPHQTILLNRC
jgi:hypothetical protein